MHAAVSDHDEVGFLPAGDIEDHVGGGTDPGVGLGLDPLAGERLHVVMQVPLHVLLALGVVVAADAVSAHEIERAPNCLVSAAACRMALAAVAEPSVATTIVRNIGGTVVGSASVAR